jgi:hypothetical protein
MTVSDRLVRPSIAPSHSRPLQRSPSLPSQMDFRTLALRLVPLKLATCASAALLLIPSCLHAAYARGLHRGHRTTRLLVFNPPLMYMPLAGVTGQRTVSVFYHLRRQSPVVEKDLNHWH